MDIHHLKTLLQGFVPPPAVSVSLQTSVFYFIDVYSPRLIATLLFYASVGFKFRPSFTDSTLRLS